MNFFQIYFFISLIIFGIQIYLFIKKKPMKEKLKQTSVKLDILNIKIKKVGNDEISHSIDDIVSNLSE